MKPGIPWSVKGIEPEVREAAKLAARRAGMTLGEWLNSVILDQNEHIVGMSQAKNHPGEYFVPPSLPEQPRSDAPARAPAAAERRDDNALRLQDIAQQLADLAQRERQSAPLPSFEPSRTDAREEFERIVERIDDNERQTVEALSAVNDRLSMLGQQISLLGRTSSFGKPEDVPGYAALESAIRNVVEHIEVSEKRTRDSLKAMQDRLAEMASRGSVSGEDVLRAAPVLGTLESRLTDMVNRIQRSEGLMSERVEGVKSAAQQMANQAQSSAVTAARGELREMETRVLAALKEAQAVSSQPQVLADVAKLRNDIGSLAKRMDEIKAATASDRDLTSLRVALEQLSTRVAQGPDMRPLSDMDKRLGEINRKLEQAAASSSKDAPKFTALEQRIADLDQRLADAVRQQGDPRALQRLEQSIAAANDRVARTEQQVTQIERMEQAIQQLHASLEQSKSFAAKVAEDAAGRVAERMRAGDAPSGPSPELRALEDGLRAIRESAVGAERRNQDTFEAIHETLAEIVNKLAKVEAAPSAPASAPLRSEPQPAVLLGHPEAQAAPPPRVSEDGTVPVQEPLSSGDDFIAAARRAAQAAASRPAALRAEYAVLTPGEPEKRRFSLPFLNRAKKTDAAAPSPAPAPKPDGAGSAGDKPFAFGLSRRKALIYAGALLLITAVIFTYRGMASPASAPEQIPAPAQPAPQKSGALMPSADPLVTGSLAKVISEPAPTTVEMPPPQAGTAALRTAAVNGDPRAQFVIAGRYLEGKGLPPDEAKAFYWYQQAAARGLAPAQYRLATLFELGKGTHPDATRALLWYERAAAAGNVMAMHNAAVLAAGDKAGPADYAKAFRWFKAAAERGFRDSQFNVAILYERGLGTNADKSEAYLWYSLAQRQGDAASGERAAALAGSLADAQLKALSARLAAWAPESPDDKANSVTALDPAWTEAAAGALIEQPAPLAAPVDVAEARQLLDKLGYSVGDDEGLLGTRMRNAIRLYQLKSGMKVNGQLTPQLVRAMRAEVG